MKSVISMLVDNHSGVLLRVAGLITRRGFNIDSLTVCETQDKSFSRMTIAVEGDFQVIRQMTRQLAKLEDVVKIEILNDENSVSSEILLIKINVSGGLPLIMDAARTRGAKVLDVSDAAVILELTGKSDEIDDFIGMMKEFGIIELARTGKTSLAISVEEDDE